MWRMQYRYRGTGMQCILSRYCHGTMYTSDSHGRRHGLPVNTDSVACTALSFCVCHALLDALTHMTNIACATLQDSQ